MPKPRLFRVLVTFSYLRLCLPKSHFGTRNILMRGAREVLQGRDYFERAENNPSTGILILTAGSEFRVSTESCGVSLRMILWVCRL